MSDHISEKCRMFEVGKHSRHPFCAGRCCRMLSSKGMKEDCVDNSVVGKGEASRLSATSDSASKHITAGALQRGLHMLSLSKNSISTIDGLRHLTHLHASDLIFDRLLRLGYGNLRDQVRKLGNAMLCGFYTQNLIVSTPNYKDNSLLPRKTDSSVKKDNPLPGTENDLEESW